MRAIVLDRRRGKSVRAISLKLSRHLLCRTRVLVSAVGLLIDLGRIVRLVPGRQVLAAAEASHCLGRDLEGIRDGGRCAGRCWGLGRAGGWGLGLGVRYVDVGWGRRTLAGGLHQSRLEHIDVLPQGKVFGLEGLTGTLNSPEILQIRLELLYVALFPLPKRSLLVPKNVRSAMHARREISKAYRSCPGIWTHVARYCTTRNIDHR